LGRASISGGWEGACSVPGTVGNYLKKPGFLAIISVMTGENRSTALPSVLLEFRATNVRSFREPLELSLHATAMAEEGVPREVPWREGTRHPLLVLPAAGIFGANASGKTNLLRVMDDMRRIVLNSFKTTSRSSRIPQHPFRLDPDAENAPSEFCVDLVLNGIRHEYGFRVDDTKVIEEWAHRYTHGKVSTLFRRKGNNVDLIGELNRAKGRAVREILRPNSLFLSAAAAADHPDFVPLYEWFGSNLILCEANNRPARWLYTARLLARDDSRARVLDMLHAADLGIIDAHTRSLDPEIMERLKKALQALNDSEELASFELAEDSLVNVTLSHRGSRDSVDFEVADESLGTLVWLGLVGPVLDALSHGTVLLADEIESSLHPALVAQLVRTFQDKASNPNSAQLIFNSHEAGLLGNSTGERVLGRDQVWFTEKLHDGRTRLYPLSDLNPRIDEAVSRRYLAGRYGATPIISDAEFTALAASVSAGGKEK
jgi:AAA15 family ATPase/GTPase